MGSEVPSDRKRLVIAAKSFRSRGWAYSQISDRLKIPKSTLSHWLSGLPPSPHQTPSAHLLRIKKIQQMGALANKKLREERLRKIAEEVQKELEDFPEENVSVLRGLLSVLYWAEGSKTIRGLSFANTDPKLVLLFTTLLRRCYSIDEKRLRIRVHIHHYHDAEKVIDFWSKLLRIPREQFGKIYRKRRSATKRFRANFMGICFVRYSDSALQHRILSTGYRLQQLLTPS